MKDLKEEEKTINKRQRGKRIFCDSIKEIHTEMDKILEEGEWEILWYYVGKWQFVFKWGYVCDLYLLKKEKDTR